MEMGVVIAVIVAMLFVLGLVVVMFAAHWKIYDKAGQPGWASLIPIYNLYILLKIIGKPWYWMLLMLIPGVNLIFGIWSANMLSKSFGKDEGYTVGIILMPFVFLLILAFGKSQYQGPYGDPELYRQYRERNQGGFDFERNELV